MSISSDSQYAALSTADAALEMSCGGYGTAGFQLSGTWAGTVTFEGTVDAGTWQTLNVTKTNSTSQVTSATSNGIWVGACAGLMKVRARFSTAGSGTVDVRILLAGTGGGSGSSGGGGGGGGTSSDFAAAFPAQGTAAGFIDGSGNMSPALVDAVTNRLQVDIVSGGGGSSPFGSPVPADGVAIGFEDAGGDLAPVVLEADGSIPVTVISGGGSNGSVGTVGVAAPTEATEVGFVDGAGDLAALALDNLDYDSGAGSQAISVIGIALPGAGGPVAGGTATNPIRIDPTGSTTQPVSAASLPLPSGAATLSEQQTQTTALGTLLTSANFAAAFGTAGTADSQVMSVQGIASMTPVQVSQATAANLKAQVSSTFKQLWGTSQTVINTGTDIAASNFSGAPSATYDNTTDSAVPYATKAMAMLEAPDWAAAPAAGTTVDLYGVLLNVDGTDDETDAPSGTASGGAHYFGSWIIAAADALQRRAIVIDTTGVLQCDFYIRNGTAQNMNNDAGTNCVVKITPLGYGFA